MNHYRLSFPSDIGCTVQLRRSIALLSSIEGYGGRFASELELCLHEAFVNAVIHGNHGDPGLLVIMALRAGGHYGSRFLEVSVKDEGQGFELPPSIAGGLCSAHSDVGTSGRGLYLINHFAESLRVERQTDGCVLVLRYIPF